MYQSNIFSRLCIFFRYSYFLSTATLFCLAFQFPRHLARRQQSVMHAAARLIYASSNHDHVTQACTPASTALAVSSMADRLQAGSTRLQVSSRLGPAFYLADDCTIMQTRSFASVSVPLRHTNYICSPYYTSYVRWPSLPSCHSSIEWGIAYDSVLFLPHRFLLFCSPLKSNSSLFVTCLCCACEVTLSIVFTYLNLLTYLICSLSTEHFCEATCIRAQHGFIFQSLHNTLTSKLGVGHV